MKQSVITAAFVDSAPDVLENGILYVSEKYKIALHLCCCGCGEEVVTPLNTAGWRLHKEGASVTLSPSIGNWKYQCKSHYWITKNQVFWAEAMSPRQIELVMARDKADREAYIAEINRKIDIDEQSYPATKLSIFELLACGVGFVVGVLWVLVESSGTLQWLLLIIPLVYLSIRFYFWRRGHRLSRRQC